MWRRDKIFGQKYKLSFFDSIFNLDLSSNFFIKRIYYYKSNYAGYLISFFLLSLILGEPYIPTRLFH